MVDFLDSNKWFGVILGIVSMVVGLGYGYFFISGEPITIKADFLVPDSTSAMTIAPFVLLNDQSQWGDYSIDEILCHEKVHIIQNWSCLALGGASFYGIYGLNYVVNLGIYDDPDLAYYNIFFERQAYKYQYEHFKPDLEVNF
ncbi:MAG: hypothetical protein PWQ77_2042 [Kosmotogales bacterium]|nr:hypothetical protein [Kosmotogales bacterium]